jgi:hypothetical protein
VAQALFDRDWVGVSYSPYTKLYDEEGKTPPWNNYTKEEVKIMLRLVSTRFRRIATYGMGHSGKCRSRVSGSGYEAYVVSFHNLCTCLREA